MAKLKRVLYVYLPLGEKAKIFPVGIAYLAQFVHHTQPAVEQRVVDLSVIRRPLRRQRLCKEIRGFAPDIIAFSWRHVRYFGEALYDDNLRNIMFGSCSDVRSHFIFLREAIASWYHYVSTIYENCGHIFAVKKMFPGLRTVIGGAGFSIFYQDILKKLPEGITGIIGEGEGALADFLSRPHSSNARTVVRKGNRILEERIQTEPLGNGLTGTELHAVDYGYIRTIFPEYTHYMRGAIGVQTNRGCKKRCVYCPDTAKDGKTIVIKNKEEVIKEIKSIKEVFNTRDIWFCDRLVISEDTSSSFSDLLSGLLEEKVDLSWCGYIRPDVITDEMAGLIVASGLNKFLLPISSGSKKVLDSFGLDFKIEETMRGCQRLKNAGFKGPIEVELTFGSEGETRTDLRETAIVYEKIKSIFRDNQIAPILNFCQVLPGSVLESRLISQNYLPLGYDSLTCNPLLIKKFAYINRGTLSLLRNAYRFGCKAQGRSGKTKEGELLDFLQSLKG